MARWLLAAGSVSIVLTASAAGTPLLDYASQLSFDSPPNAAQYRRQLEDITHRLERDPPPPSDCARTLGAQRFAGLLDELGAAHAALGDHAAAIDAYQRALACSPRTLYLLAELSEELLYAGRYAEARAVVSRGLAIDRRDYRLAGVRSRLEFVEERWMDAISWLRFTTQVAVDTEQAAYWECFLWLAQRRTGVAHPTLIERPLTTQWPRPVLNTLEGALAEAQLLEAIEAEADPARRREILVEALYYVGEARLAAGSVDTARRYFAAVVNLKVLTFIEHYMALAELAKMRQSARG
jgi:lipoprotein NlpI